MGSAVPPRPTPHVAIVSDYVTSRRMLDQTCQEAHHRLREALQVAGVGEALHLGTDDLRERIHELRAAIAKLCGHWRGC